MDLKSTLVAGAIGAVILAAIAMCLVPDSKPSHALPLGFVIGAGTQIGVRLLGVS